jgi:signal transduction histidine kinase
VVVLPRLLRVASFRLTALYIVIFAVSTLIVGATVVLWARSALEQQITGRIEAELSLLTKEYRGHGLSGLNQAVNERAQRARTLEYLVESPASVRLAGNMPVVTGLNPGWTTITVPQRSIEDPEPTEELLTRTIDLGDGVLLAVGGSQEPIEDLEEAVAGAMVWTIGIAGTLGIIGGALVSHAFLRRVDAISRTAEAIVEGDLARRIPLRGTGDDFDRLAGTLNRMLDRIAVLMGSLRQVSADVAHDLRTPLTRLYHRLEEARSRARSPTEYEASIDAALAEAEGLLQTFTALLRIAHVEGGSPRSRFTRANLSELVETVVEAYQPDAEAGGHLLIGTIVPDLFMTGDRELLTQAIANLIENALGHTPPGTRIAVCLQRGCQTGIVLSVADNGPGVDEAELPRLTDRFYRGERSRTAPGNGLGLSLVSAIAELHGATLGISTTSPGFCATITVPCGNDARGSTRVTE